jgi:isopenicillin N synthase-like dioxygenase
VEECYSKLTELGLLIQKILNECMGLPPGFLKDYNDNLMIVRRYLPATEEESTGFSAHEDASCITLICQDDVGGLEVLKDGHWVPAEPGGGSIIVNIGDVIKVKPERRVSNSTQIRSGPVTKISAFFLFFPNVGAEQQQAEERDTPGGEETCTQALVDVLLQPARR